MALYLPCKGYLGHATNPFKHFDFGFGLVFCVGLILGFSC